MDKENLKIKTYKNGVSSLPDYPSDAGYTAEELKAIFDSRSDNEIKEKHNALVEEFAEHKDGAEAHSELFAEMKEDLTLNIQDGEGDASLKQKAWSEASLNSATGKGAVSLCGYNKANAKCSVALNYNNEVNAENAFAANQSNKIPVGANGAFVAGLANEAKGAYQAIFGTYSDVALDDAFVVGNGASANGRKNAFKVDKYGNAETTSLKTGNAEVTSLKAEDTVECEALYAQSVIAAYGLTARGNIHIGNGVLTERDADFAQNTVKGGGSFAFGGSNEIYGRNCIALMSSNKIPERSADDQYEMESVFIAGHANTATGPHQAIFGTYATPQVHDVFVIGNGDKNGKKNAFAVGRNGSVRIGGNELTLGSTVLTEDNLKALLGLLAGESV